MALLQKPEVICTHESDLDGLVSGLLLRRLAARLYSNDPRLEAFHYQGWKSRPMLERIAWVTDFTFEPRLDRPGWLILDHHTTDARPKDANLIHDPQKSAARLCYDLCLQENLGSPKLDRLVHLTNVGDLFLIDDPDFDLACDYASLVKSYGFWPLYDIIGGNPENLIDHPLLEVMAVKRRVEDPLGHSWALKNITEISPTVGLVRTCIGNTNLIVHKLLTERAVPYPILVTLFKRGNGQMVVSFRSANGEALKAAALLQGGGHPNAAGTTLPQSVRDFESAAVYLRQILNPKPTHNSTFNSLEQAFASLQL